MTFPRRFLTGTALASVFSVCLASVPGLAFAQDDKSATETAAARSLAIEGLKLAQAGNCSEAVDKLERSEKLRHSPIVLGKLGECLVNLGKVVEGTEALRRMLREPLPPDPTPALQQAYERAQAALDSAKPRLAGLTINVKAPSDAKVSVTVDGAPGFWISGPPHLVRYLDLTGRERSEMTRLAGDTLVWQAGNALYRMESGVGMVETIRLAESIEE